MGSLSSRPQVPQQLDMNTPQGATIQHHNLIECYKALEFLSQEGVMKLRRDKEGGYEILVVGVGKHKADSMCDALKGLMEMIDD